ncbi:MAG: TonB-dependent receptor [Methylophaga sp.]|uniref:TonB-dependent receptor domain-containing protein n=1 Tax=Methylophaga sp. UBA678 TaxID=1946901 RepID=UPI000C454504|nr:TonB-dependent receptor [Methylophaga sp. UBA678]MAX50844.1 TonB-dependent receptor [Methylophaga sp.]|tara:strand:- start:32501 stop:36010 length:3510 start_codon:yes stop_codon:yes gene_type:complete
MSKRTISRDNSFIKFTIIIALLAFFYLPPLFAETVQLADNEKGNETEKANRQYNIPAGPLSKALSNYTGINGFTFSFDPSLTEGKTTQGLQGSYSLEEGFEQLLKGSGLIVIPDTDGGYLLAPGQEELPALGDDRLILDTVQVRAQRFYEVGPLPGLGLTKEEIPANVQSISAKEIKNARSLSMTDLFNTKLQGVTVNDYQGNPFQMDIQYRGFTAGPQIGTPQGLSVFIDGIRVNEPFGDVVNWDLIPMNAIAGVDLFPGSNPIFGLNTLGGSFALKTKDGFNNTSADAEVLAGSFGRKQLQMENGWNNGTIAFFGAASLFDENGWRDSSPSEVNQLFGKASYRGEKLDLHFSTLIVDTNLVGNGLIPSEEYRQDREGVFTAPDTTENRLQQFQLAGAYQVNDTFSITGQVYRRTSRRDSQGADVFTEFDGQVARRNLNEGEEFTCLFETTNEYGLPDYYILSEADTFNLLNRAFGGEPGNEFTSVDELVAAIPTEYGGKFNDTLPDDYANYAIANFLANISLDRDVIVKPGTGPGPQQPDFDPSDGYYPTITEMTQTAKASASDPATYALQNYLNYYYVDSAGDTNYMFIAPALNGDKCVGDTGVDPTVVLTDEGLPQTVDGADYSETNPGVVDGTPTAVLTDNTIDQVVDGVSLQLNWNTDKHKFMVGASVDRPTATYESTQQLGLLTANREFYYAPDEIRDQYLASDVPIANNNFEGEQLTKSLYFSETWSPVETWHFNLSARYNDTQGENRIRSRTYSDGYLPTLARLEALPDDYNVCRPGEECPTGYYIPDGIDLLNPEETESFSYYSLNPSVGAAWQATPELNLYANFSQGVRVPSVIELGCALDKTPVSIGTDANGEKKYIYKSLKENRSCSLPSTLSGDPYLPQIKAQTVEVGVRGIIDNDIQWNLSAYQTNIKDDLYLVSYPDNRNFFDSIGATRRQGIEAGLSGQKGKWSFSVNYSLTDATFQDKFTIAGNDNSSSYEDYIGNYNYSRLIDVEPGSRMPGVSLHNLNATVNYQVTPKWTLGLTAVAHSSSYVRGNENNKHRPGVVLYDTTDRRVNGVPVKVARKATNNPGKVPGYMVFNFQSNYQLTKNFSVNLLVNNIFDKEYFSAGTLGRNPFSPSTYGAIGPDGYNHNSLEWNSTNFVAPGAPRGAWVSVRWLFD